MKKLENKFHFWVPAEINKAKDKDGNEIMRLGGIASTADIDTDGETLITDGFDISYLKNSGLCNWHHQAKKEPSTIIGEPSKANLTKSGLYVEVDLYKDSKIARDVFELAQVLEKNSKTRRLGFSIEGKADERDLLNDKKIVKASITGIAVTHMPKNSHTLAEIIKGIGVEDELEYDIISEENIANGGKVKYIADVERADGSRLLVDSEGNIVYKAMSTTSASALRREHVDGNDKDSLSSEENAKKYKKFFTKAEVMEKIFEDNSAISIEKAKQIYNKILITMESKDKTITEDIIKKAYDELGLNEETTDIEKGKTCDKGLEKSEEDEEEKKKTKKEDKEDEEDVEKGVKDDEDEEEKEEDDEEDIDDDREEKKEEDDDEDEEPVKKEKKEIKKALDSDDDDEKPNDIQKAILDMNTKSDEKFKAVATILKGIEDNFNKRLDEIGNQKEGGRKSITKAIERFPEEKADGLTLSLSKDRQKILNVLDKFTFEKAEMDNDFAKAMTLFESANQMPSTVIARLKLEKGITITQ